MITNIDELIEDIANKDYDDDTQLAIYNNSPDRQRLHGELQPWIDIIDNKPILSTYVSDLPINPLELRETLIELGEQAFNQIT